MTISGSLFDAPVRSPLGEASAWVTGVALGEIAVGLCVIAVAIVGLTMLSGRLPVRRGITVVIGCFVLFGAPFVASGLIGNADLTTAGVPQAPPLREHVLYEREPLPEATYNPYAGASLRREGD